MPTHPLASRSPVLLGTLLVSLAWAPVAAAQNEPAETEPSTDPPAPLKISADDPDLRSPRPLLPEGSFLSGQEGTLVLTTAGDRLFVFLPSENETPITAIILVPCGELARMERAAREAGSEYAIFKVTGQILVYHRRNYLLPTAWTQREPDQNPSEQLPPPTTPPEDDEDIAALIQELEQSRDAPRSALRRGDRLWLAPPRTPEQEQTRAPIADGTMISRRTGRLVRQGVVWTIVFDNSPAQTEAKDAPLVLLPCLIHERLERLAARRADEFKVEISGRVFAHGGRNFLLPSVFQIVSTDSVRPIQ